MLCSLGFLNETNVKQHHSVEGGHDAYIASHSEARGWRTARTEAYVYAHAERLRGKATFSHMLAFLHVVSVQHPTLGAVPGQHRGKRGNGSFLEERTTAKSHTCFANKRCCNYACNIRLDSSTLDPDALIYSTTRGADPFWENSTVSTLL